MNFREVHIPSAVGDFLMGISGGAEAVNALLVQKCGITQFFSSDGELDDLRNTLQKTANLVCESERREYGDYQTNATLARKSVQHVLCMADEDGFDLVLEPTCGKGAFLLAALQELTGVKKVVGIEIHLPYVWETKFRILDHFLTFPAEHVPDVSIIHADIFSFDLAALAKETRDLRTLIIGNPPWVTNSELGALDSENLPRKSNFKRHSGIDAITGKGNFDIGEYILLELLRNFQHHSGAMGFLVKSAVVKGLMHGQQRHGLRIGNIQSMVIDSKREFDVSVEAGLFFAELGHEPDTVCTERDFYTSDERAVFGWCDGNFVRSVDDYAAAADVEGRSPLEWRQGLKHDCSRVMELERVDGHFTNALDQKLEVEEDLIHGLLKSSDLKGTEDPVCRKFTIVTQQRVGQETAYIRQRFPLTYAYLDGHRELFSQRKSSIYRGKPAFSIFGIGEYSFAPYKVAVSGLYKRTLFTLVPPLHGRPVMLDDTCYFIGFDNAAHARIARFLLNSEPAQRFLRAIIFPDSKRAITKDVLMRVDLGKLYRMMDFNNVTREIPVSLQDWESFEALVDAQSLCKQTSLF